MSGQWQSQEIQNLSGTLQYSSADTNKTLTMSGSPFPLGTGIITELNYTPAGGESPISFFVVFNSGYTGNFAGTADNSLCPINVQCIWEGTFIVEGVYKIMDTLSTIVDQGTFDLGKD